MTSLPSLMDALLGRLGWTSLQAALLVGAIWLICRQLPRLSAATRSLLRWLVGAQLLLGLALPTPVALPLLAAAYFWLLARRKKAAVVYASLALPRAALGPRQRLRRHIPPLLFLLSLGAALLALARPVATMTLPTDTFTLVLAMDVSRSMLASDIPPSRISASMVKRAGTDSWTTAP